MGQIGIFNSLAGLYLEYRRCVFLIPLRVATDARTHTGIARVKLAAEKAKKAA